MFRPLCLSLTSCCLLLPSTASHAEDWRYSLRAGAASDVRKDRKTGYKGSDELNGMGSIKSRSVLGLDRTYHMGPLILWRVI